MITMRIGTITSQMIPHQSRLYMMKRLVVVAPRVTHIPLPLTKYSSSLASWTAVAFDFVKPSETFEASKEFPIAFGKEPPYWLELF